VIIIIPNIWQNKKNVPVTTNQILLSLVVAIIPARHWPYLAIAFSKDLDQWNLKQFQHFGTLGG
jgi:P2-related tail formation protein